MLQALLYNPGAAAEASSMDPPTEIPCEAHVDPGLLTLVYTPGLSGLQVKLVRSKNLKLGKNRTL